MKVTDYEKHADLIRRVMERHKATAAANPLVLLVLEMLEHEYRAAPQIMPVEDD